MRLKTAYRKSAKEIPATEIPEPNIPEIKIEGEPATVAAVRFESNPEEESPEVATAIKTASDADTSALALKRQIEALRQSEQLQRQQQMAMAAQRPPTREEKLAYWRSIGTDEAELKFLEHNPELIDIPELTAAAAAEAQQQGHKRGTEAHMTATKEIFDKHLAHLKAQAEAAQPTPEFFRPAPTPEQPGTGVLCECAGQPWCYRQLPRTITITGEAQPRRIADRGGERNLSDRVREE